MHILFIVNSFVRNNVYIYTYLKLVSAIFINFFIILPNNSPSKTMKKNFFHLKSSFRYQDIQIFVFLFFPLFLPVGHCFRG